MTDPGERVAIARLGRPHGVWGRIAAHADGPTLGTLNVGDAVTVRVDGVDHDLVLEYRRGEAPKAVLAFAGLGTRELVARLTGGSIVVDATMLPTLVDDAFYVRDLVGFEVRDGDRVLGLVRDVVPGPANDAMVVDGPTGEVLVPFTFDAVVDIDEPARVIALRDGLLGAWAWGEDE